jgi:signal transduction histidine kinase
MVDISVSKNSNHTEITIKDNGPGIKEKDLDKIFDRFYRPDTSRNTEGAGLGLSIAKAIIQAHNGKIEAESEVGKGSCFIITLPLKY